MRFGTYEDRRVQWGQEEGQWIDLLHSITLLTKAPFGYRAYTSEGVYEIDITDGSAQIRHPR